MSEVRSKIPFDQSSGKYRKSWQATQEEQVSNRHTVSSSTTLSKHDAEL